MRIESIPKIEIRNNTLHVSCFGLSFFRDTWFSGRTDIAEVVAREFNKKLTENDFVYLAAKYGLK